MTSIKHPGSVATDQLPVLTQVAGKAPAGDLPTLTEIVEETVPHTSLSNKERQQLLRQLEKHLETLFSQKLALKLEQLQRQTVKQAISELKVELPDLLRDVMNAHLDSRK
jgi:hypothetical protein